MEISEKGRLWGLLVLKGKRSLDDTVNVEGLPLVPPAYQQEALDFLDCFSDDDRSVTKVSNELTEALDQAGNRIEILENDVEMLNDVLLSVVFKKEQE